MNRTVVSKISPTRSPYSHFVCTAIEFLLRSRIYTKVRSLFTMEVNSVYQNLIANFVLCAAFSLFDDHVEGFVRISAIEQNIAYPNVLQCSTKTNTKTVEQIKMELHCLVRKHATVGSFYIFLL